eukprot:SAG22_NODE_1494_length_4300_cov_6.567722_2_plen_167_part_00
MICNAEFLGVPAGGTVNGIGMPIQLVPQGGTWLLPSTSGSLIKCSYRAIVEMDLPMCPDISVAIPLEIVEPDPARWNPTPQLRPLPGQQFTAVPVATAAAIPVAAAPSTPYVPWTGNAPIATATHVPGRGLPPPVAAVPVVAQAQGMGAPLLAQGGGQGQPPAYRS